MEINNERKNDKKCCDNNKKTNTNLNKQENKCHEHSCCCGGTERHSSVDKKVKTLFYAVGAVLLLVAFLGELGQVSFWLSVSCAAAVYLLFGKDVWVNACKGVIEKRVFTEFTLMCVASIGAIILGEFADAAAVIYLYSLGETVSEEAYSRSLKNISELIDITEERVTVVSGGRSETVLAEDVNIGDVVSLRVGDRVSLDGEVVRGEGFADTSAVTGESVPRELKKGVKCLSGSLLISGAVLMSVESKYEDSTANKLKQAVDRASKQKAHREKKITEIAKVFTPIAFCVAVAVFAVMVLISGDWRTSLRSSLVVLVAACPCALVLSVPLTYFSGIGRAAKRGIVFKNGQTIDNVAQLETVVFDKTGTLTSSVPVFVGVVVPENAPIDKKQLLDVSKAALLSSPHPSAKAFCEKYSASVVYNASDVKNIGGRGVVCKIDGNKVALGNRALMREIGVETAAIPNSAIYVAVESEFCGALLFDIKPKENALSEISELRANGIRRVAVMSGDNEKSVKSAVDEIGISEYYSELKPDQKLARFEYIYKEEKKRNRTGKVAFCGDGLNDSAVIARADVGVAMGSGADVTVESADVVLVDDNLKRLNEMMAISKETVRIVKQNVFLSLGVKIGAILIGVLGYPSVEIAIAADVGAAVLCVLNASRAGKLSGK